MEDAFQPASAFVSVGKDDDDCMVYLLAFNNAVVEQMLRFRSRSFRSDIRRNLFQRTLMAAHDVSGHRAVEQQKGGDAVTRAPVPAQ
jgi:hypothetical protein